MCVISTVATDALVLKHQVISIHNSDDLVFDMWCAGPVPYKNVPDV